MLIPKVAVQFFRVLGLIVAELAFVRFQFIVLFMCCWRPRHWSRCEGTLITAENYSLQVFGQFGSAHFNGDNPLLCGNKLTTKMGTFTDGKTLSFWEYKEKFPHLLLKLLMAAGL